METTSENGRVQLSKETADLLFQFGKENWIKPRDLHVVAKGKGILDTFWLVAVDDDEATVRTDDPRINNKVEARSIVLDLQTSDERLVEWNVNILQGLVRKIVAFRQKANTSGTETPTQTQFELRDGHTYLDELQEIIELPQHQIDGTEVNEEDVVLPAVVIDELRHLVATIAKMYNNNPFHNFEVRKCGIFFVLSAGFPHIFLQKTTARKSRDHVSPQVDVSYC